MSRINLKELQAFVASYVAEAKQAGTWSANYDSITGLVEKCAQSFTIDDGGFVDLLGELDGQLRQGYIEEYFSGLVPCAGRPDNGATNDDELAPNRPVFDEPAYSYPLVDATTGRPGIRFKTTVDQEWFERYVQDGNDASLVNYIIKKLYDSFFAFKYEAKRQLIGNLATKAVAANEGVLYTKNTTKAKCGYIYKEAQGTSPETYKYYIMRVNMTAAENKTLATLAAETPSRATEITPNLIEVLATPTDDTTGEAFIKAVKKDVEKLTIGPSEGTSLSGSTIGSVNSELMLYVKPGVLASLDVDTLAGAFNVDKLAIPAMVKVLPDFGKIVDTSNNDISSKVFAILVDKRGLKLNENYTKANATPVNGSLYTNHFLHFSGTAFISKHCAVKVYKNS